MKSFKNILAEAIATSFYVGKIKYCPGTFGSLVAFPIYIIIFSLTIHYQIMFPFTKIEILGRQLISSWLILLIACVVLYMLGLYFVKIYLNYLENCNKNSSDPKEVVIDEVVGQLLAITLCSPSLNLCPWPSKILHILGNPLGNIIFIFLPPFILFRLFDILKPWPISWFDENIKGAQGIMIDDIIAAIFTIISYYTIILLLINFI